MWVVTCWYLMHQSGDNGGRACRDFFAFLCLQNLQSTFVYGGCHSRLVGWICLSNIIVIICFWMFISCVLSVCSAVSRITLATFVDIGGVVTCRTRLTWRMTITWCVWLEVWWCILLWLLSAWRFLAIELMIVCNHHANEILYRLRSANAKCSFRCVW